MRWEAPRGGVSLFMGLAMAEGGAAAMAGRRPSAQPRCEEA